MKRYRNFIQIALACMTFAFISCDDWLETDVPSARPTKDFYQTPIQAEQALLGIYNGLLPLPEE